PPTQRSCRGVGAQHAAPLRALSGYTTRIVNPTLPARPPLPGLRLPLGRRRLGPGATLAVFVHAVIVGVLVVGGRGLMGGGRGAGVGAARGAGVGPGTGDAGGSIFPAAPRTANVPPLGKVPGSVAGRTYRVTFWVSADGRVARVEVDPPIADAEYGREFQQR